MIKYFCDCCDNEIIGARFSLSVEFKADLNKNHPDPFKFNHICNNCAGEIYKYLKDFIEIKRVKKAEL